MTVSTETTEKFTYLSDSYRVSTTAQPREVLLELGLQTGFFEVARFTVDKNGKIATAVWASPFFASDRAEWRDQVQDLVCWQAPLVLRAAASGVDGGGQ